MAVVTSVLAVVFLRGDPRAILVVVVLSTLSGAVAWTTDWNDVYGRSWFGLHRQSFLTVAELGRSGPLAGQLRRDAAELPAGLSPIAVNGSVSIVGECDRTPVLFVAAFTGIPDGAFGWLHLTCDRWTGEYLDGYGDPLIPEIDLGDGWWWAG